MKPTGKTTVSVRANATKDASIGMRGGKATIYVEATAATSFSAKADGGVVEISFKGPGLWGAGRLTRDMASRLVIQILEAAELSSELENSVPW
jgi:hypothetical protein